MIGDERVLRTELDFLIACVIEMRRLRASRQGMLQAQLLEKDITTYFRLPPELCDSQFYDVIVELAGLPAGSMKMRQTEALQTIHEMHQGSFFRLNGRLCVLDTHKRFEGHPTEGFLTYHYVTEDWMKRELSYNDAWTMAEENTLTFGR